VQFFIANGGLYFRGFSADSDAGEIKIFAAGATKEVEARISPVLRSAGISVSTTYDTVGAFRDRVLHGDRPDMVLLSDDALILLDNQHLLSGQREKIGSIAVALAVKRGSPIPDITTPDALKNALLQSKAIAYADPARGATAGTHFSKVLDSLGIRTQLGDRVGVLPFGIDVIDAVGTGRFELGASQSSEIALHPEVSLVGPLPVPYALTTNYSGALLKNANPEAVGYLRHLVEKGGWQR
jgi:molybdate transport system substrate-binding protein